jgi:hypothetical protein
VDLLCLPVDDGGHELGQTTAGILLGLQISPGDGALFAISNLSRQGVNLVIRNLLVKDYPIIVRLAGFLEPSQSTETLLAMPFTGVWEGIDPVDESIITLSLTQTGSRLTGTYKDTFNPTGRG